MVDIKDSIRIFREKFLPQGIALTNSMDSFIGESICRIFYAKNWHGGTPLVIENGHCHHIPYGGIKLNLNSGRTILLFDSNTFSEYGGTFGIDFRELESDFEIEGQEEQTNDINWKKLINQKIVTVDIIWLDDDGWQSYKEVKGQQIITLDETSQGIFPHGISIEFANELQIFILVVEPDEYIESENKFKYLRGGEEFLIAFNAYTAKKQGLIIEGVNLDLRKEKLLPPTTKKH